MRLEGTEEGQLGGRQASRSLGTQRKGQPGAIWRMAEWLMVGAGHYGATDVSPWRASSSLAAGRGYILSGEGTLIPNDKLLATALFSLV